MTARQIMVSPDRQAVAIRGDAADPEAWNAWGVMHGLHGGHWSSTADLNGWVELTVPDLPQE